MHRSWSHLTKEYLEGLYQQKGNWVEVADFLKIDKSSLLGIRKRLGFRTGVYPKVRKPPVPSRLEPRKDQIFQMAKDGKNCGQIAESIGERDPEIVRDFLQRRGVERQPVGAPRGARNPNWHGGRAVDKGGYILVKAPIDHPYRNHNGYIREHRLVLEQKLGRYLLPEEVVHHIDGNCQNNDPDNLCLFENNGRHIAQEWSDPEWKEHQRAVRRGVRSGAKSQKVSGSGDVT